jgi:hypothetical protein
MWLQTPTVFWLGEESFLSPVECISINDAIQTAQAIVPEPIAFEVEKATEKLERHK